MDQEGSNSRRRSSRLAARGVVGTPRAEVVKKPPKTSEKPKRSKRKTSEEIIELPDAKKIKTEVTTSSDEVNKAEDNKTNNLTNDLSAVTPINVDNIENNEEPNDKSANDELTEKIIEKTPVNNEEKEKIDSSLKADDEEQIKNLEITEQPKNEVEESISIPVKLENSNGNDEVAKPVDNIGFSTANGDTEEMKLTTNGNKSAPESEAIEPIKVRHGDTNHVVETELIKAIPVTAITNINKDASNDGQVTKEHVVENSVGNVAVTADAKAPIVDQSSTVMS